MGKPDIVIYSEGRPVVVVEAKGRPVSRSFEGPVLAQLRQYTTMVNTPWAILTDPETTRIFKRDDLRRPWLTLSTGEILQSIPIETSVVGERTLIRALEGWLHNGDAIVARHPELRDFVAAVGEEFTSTEE